MSKYTNVLRVVPKSMCTRNGFKWPVSGPVQCPDWDPTPDCGRGLHGWLWTPECCPWTSNLFPEGVYNPNVGDLWLVVRVLTEELVSIDGVKVKFPRGNVIFCGSFAGAIKKLKHPPHLAGFCGIAVADHDKSARSGPYGIAYGRTYARHVKAGDYGCAVAACQGSANTGGFGVSVVRGGGDALTQHGGVAWVQYSGHAQAGNAGVAIVDSGSACSGFSGISVSRGNGLASVGGSGVAIAGVGGVVAAGTQGLIAVQWDDPSGERRWATAVAGVTPGIIPNRPYRVDAKGNFVEVTDLKKWSTSGA